MSKRFDSASLILTEKCNLACDYCYEKCTRAMNSMDIDTAMKSIDFLIAGAKANGVKFLYLYMFGGEPLMAFPVLKEAFAYACKRTKEEGMDFQCKLISNCTLFPEGYADFVRDWSNTIGNVYIQLSIDGIPEVQDKHRHTASGGDSSELVAETLKKYKDMADELKLTFGKEIQIHSVVSRESVAHLYDSYMYFRELGFPGFVGMPVIEDDWTDEDAQVYEEQLQKIADKAVEDCEKEKTDVYFKTMSSMSKCFAQMPERACAAGYNFCTIAPNGDIYPCHRFYFNSTEEKRCKIGNINDSYEVLDENRDLFLQTTNENMIGDGRCMGCENKECRKCIATNFEYNGNLVFTNPDYCKISKVEKKISKDMQSKLLGKGIITSQTCGCGGNGMEAVMQGIADLNNNLKSTLEPLKDMVDAVKKDIQDNRETMVSISNKVDAMMDVMMHLVNSNESMTKAMLEVVAMAKK